MTDVVSHGGTSNTTALHDMHDPDTARRDVGHQRRNWDGEAFDFRVWLVLS
jgi:hypothetical protein